MNKQPSIFKWLVMVLVATLLAQPVFTPPPVSAAPPQDSTKFSTSFQTKSSLLQTPDILIQCVGSLSACSDLTPNTTVTEYVDFTNDDRRIEFKILCQGWNCTNRDIYYSVTMDVEWGNGIDAPWFHEYATLGTTPGGSGGLVTMPCGTGLSGSCSLSTSGVISADDINPDPNSSWHFGITNTGGTSASGEWHHRVLNIQVSLDPAIDCSPDSFEPDDTLATGSPITLGEVQRHTLCPQGDEDWVTFHSNVTLPGARNFLVETFDLEPDDINPNGNTRIIVEDALRNQIGINLDRGLAHPSGSTQQEVKSSRVVWHPAINGLFNVNSSPETPINEQEGSGYSLRLANSFTSVDPVDQASWGPTKVNVPLIWRNGNIIYFTQYFTYEQAELDELTNLNATLAWEFRRPTIDPNGVEQSGSVDYGDYWQSVNGVCTGGEYWTNLPNHSDKFVEESNSISGCRSNSQWSEELEIYVDNPAELDADKTYYITIKFYVHDGYLNSTYQFYISKVEQCVLFLGFDHICNLGSDLAPKYTANLIEGYLQPAP